MPTTFADFKPKWLMLFYLTHDYKGIGEPTANVWGGRVAFLAHLVQMKSLSYLCLPTSSWLGCVVGVTVGRTPVVIIWGRCSLSPHCEGPGPRGLGTLPSHSPSESCLLRVSRELWKGRARSSLPSVSLQPLIQEESLWDISKNVKHHLPTVRV